MFKPLTERLLLYTITITITIYLINQINNNQ